jgi:coenzyme PQQ precursor peptide PqqA
LVLRRSMHSQENHEARFPAVSMPERPPLAHTALGTGTDCGTKLRSRLNSWFEIDEVLHRSPTMKWVTPAAAEIRFGFEITMYVANR